VLGPYEPAATPFACPEKEGGAIDPAGFLDPVSGRRYVVYKVDGNSLGGGGYCNNGVAPFRDTPVVLQEVDPLDGVTNIVREGGVVIFDRDQDLDGPLVEAPDLMFVRGEEGSGEEGVYVLFYSNHCWDSPGYSVNYATAKNITGPYVRGGSGRPLIGTGDVLNVTAPGGATSFVANGGGEEDPGKPGLVFHGNCPQGRCLFGASIAVSGTTVVLG
jgi:hypothetical protein